MTTSTAEDAIRAATSVASDVAEGRLDPAQLERQAVAELRELVGEVVGPGDPCWDLQCEIARGVLALDGIPADELSEWAAVARQKAGTVTEPAALPDCLPEVSSPPSEALRPENGDAEPELDAAPAPEAVEPTPPAVADPPKPSGYNPLTGWQPGNTRRN